MILDLGCMKLPFEGDFNTVMIFTGFASACISTTLFFNFVTPKGPALGAGTPEQVVDAFGKTMIVQAVWCIIYYNYVGAQVLGVFLSGPWAMLDGKKQTEKWGANASRFAGNQFEQSCVFIPCLWMYAGLVDYETAWTLGVLYIIGRILYPLFYVVHGRFTFFFEHITQVGYAVNGTFILGALIRGAKWDYVEFAKDHNILTPILGACLGVFTLLPGVGITIPWFIAHTVMDRKRAQAYSALVTPGDA
mmetsp:Transcript_77345/g.201585  ORF Transcript_77345/g.201585 Transcript_77345/m.201585 type:complete len:248 (+) Transcript_77345:86-829(+)